MRSPFALPLACAGALLSGCGSSPLVAYSTDTPPLVLASAAQAGVADGRARFREIFCAVLEAHGQALPDHRPCDEALTRVGTEPAPSARPVNLEPSSRGLVAVFVGGIGYECVHAWLEPAGTVERHLAQNGYGLRSIQVDGLSSSTNNARQIRDALLAMPEAAGAAQLVLIGYSKGAPDILEAVVAHPEIRGRVAAVVSASGTVAGSPLANDAEQYQAGLFRHFPGATCSAGDGGGVESLRTSVRRSWLASNPLPEDLPYYSLVTFPDPQRISAVLKIFLPQAVPRRRPQRRPDGLLRPGHPGKHAHGIRERGPLGDRVADRTLSRADRLVDRHRERLSARGPGRGRDAIRRGRPFCAGRIRVAHEFEAADSRPLRRAPAGLRRFPRARVGVSRASRHCRAGDREPRPGAPRAVRSPVVRGPHRTRRPAVRRQRGCHAGCRARLHRLGGDAGDCRRPFVFERADAGHGRRLGLDPRGRGRRGPVQARPVDGSRQDRPPSRATRASRRSATSGASSKAKPSGPSA